MFEASATHTGCAHRPLVKNGEQGRFVTPMSLHQPAGTGFLARRGFGGLVVGFGIGSAFPFRVTDFETIGFALAFGLLMDVEETVELTLASLASRRSRFLR